MVCRVDHWKSSRRCVAFSCESPNTWAFPNEFKELFKMSESNYPWIMIHGLIFIYAFIHFFFCKGAQLYSVFVTHNTAIWRDSLIAVSDWWYRSPYCFCMKRYAGTSRAWHAVKSILVEGCTDLTAMIVHICRKREAETT